MQINLISPERHAIQSYTDYTITVDALPYYGSVILSREEIIPNIHIHSLESITEDYITLLMQYKPKIVILGHQEIGKFLPQDIGNAFYRQGIGVECMLMGAACRTYNILLEEGRDVVAGFIFKNTHTMSNITINRSTLKKESA
jgi:uncharacterized protein